VGSKLDHQLEHAAGTCLDVRRTVSKDSRKNEETLPSASALGLLLCYDEGGICSIACGQREASVLRKGFLMPQVYQSPDIHKISKQGQRLFEALDAELRQKHRGQFVAIEVDSGDYFIGETAMAANQKARVKHPGKVFFLGRIAYPTAYTFKGRR
jgi:hypothetical protein